MSTSCKEHGLAEEAFLCQHLRLHPNQLWCSSRPTEEDPCPDAWCLKCDEAFQEYGEWNEHNEKKMKIELVCQGCYKRLRLGNTEI